jgi:hypothetical protein
MAGGIRMINAGSISRWPVAAPKIVPVTKLPRVHIKRETKDSLKSFERKWVVMLYANDRRGAGFFRVNFSRFSIGATSEQSTRGFFAVCH